MDNISKVLAGVIGIAGILAFLTPSEVPFASEQAATEAAASAVPAPPPSEPAPQPEPSSEITDADLVIGQPTIDGNPIVDGNPFGQDPNANAQNIADPAQQEGNTMPQAYGQQLTPQNADEAPAPL